MGDCPILSPALIGRENMDNNNYINIQGWMINELHLKGNELLVYALIYGFSQDEESKFEGSISYITEWLSSSRQTVINTLKSLEEQNLIIKYQETKNNITFNKYGVVKKFDHQSKMEEGSQKTLQGVVKNFDPIIIYNNNINKKEKEIYKEKKKVVSRAVKQMTIPAKQEVIDYCKSLSLDGEKIFNYYDVADWHDASGKPVLNWKQKIRAVWDKPENKVKIALDKSTVGETEEDKEIIKDNIFIKNTMILARIKTGSLVLVNIMNELMRLANKEETAKKILETMRESELTDVQVEYIRKYLTSKIIKV